MILNSAPLGNGSPVGGDRCEGWRPQIGRGVQPAVGGRRGKGRVFVGVGLWPLCLNKEGTADRPTCWLAFGLRVWIWLALMSGSLGMFLEVFVTGAAEDAQVWDRGNASL